MPAAEAYLSDKFAEESGSLSEGVCQLPYDGKIGEGPIEDRRPKFVAAKSHADDALLETYITQKGISGLREKQARDIWHVFRTVVNKPIRMHPRRRPRHRGVP